MKLGPRFSLRMLLIAIALVSIPMGWVAQQLNWIRQRHEFTRNQLRHLRYLPSWSVDDQRKAPWSFRLLGEESYSLCLLVVPKSQLETGRRLFPEAVFLADVTEEGRPWYVSGSMKSYSLGPRLKSVSRAADPILDVDLRIEAASRLDESERASLRSVLTSRLPGDWDLAALDDIWLLGEVGDADSIPVLERIDCQRNNVSGKFGVVIPLAIENIRTRIVLDKREDD